MAETVRINDDGEVEIWRWPDGGEPGWREPNSLEERVDALQQIVAGLLKKLRQLAA